MTVTPTPERLNDVNIEAVGQLATGTTTFNGVVPGSCTIGDGAQEIDMDLDGTTLSGTTANITINSNVLADVSLSSLTKVSEPSGVTTTPTATLNDVTGSNAGAATATVGSDSSAVNLTNQTVDQDHNITIGLSVTGASAPGSYQYTVVLSCLQR